MADQYNVIRKAMNEAVEAHRVRKGILSGIVRRGLSGLRGPARGTQSVIERDIAGQLVRRGMSRSEADDLVRRAFHDSDKGASDVAMNSLKDMLGPDFFGAFGREIARLRSGL